MKKKIKYEKAPEGIKNSIIFSQYVEDILSPPDQLLRKNETMQGTIPLSQKNLN